MPLSLTDRRSTLQLVEVEERRGDTVCGYGGLDSWEEGEEISWKTRIHDPGSTSSHLCVRNRIFCSGQGYIRAVAHVSSEKIIKQRSPQCTYMY